MRRRNLIIVLAVAAVAGLALVLPFLLKARSGEWTTKSPAALAAFGAGLEARMRFYLPDAAASFRKALELDPDFAAAKVQLLAVASDGDERKRLHQELDRIDLSRLNERERFLVEVARSRHEDQPAISDRYLASHPEDPWALFAVAGQAWEREEWDAAAGLYTRLLQVDPNWVLARNNLGYLAMAQARFVAAIRTHFKLLAGGRPLRVNAADRLLAAAPDERHAAHRVLLRAIHAPTVTAHLVRQRIGHAAAHGLQLVDGKLDAVFMAAGAAGEARVLGFGHDAMAGCSWCHRCRAMCRQTSL